jgi:hypothetical protein
VIFTSAQAFAFYDLEKAAALEEGEIALFDFQAIHLGADFPWSTMSTVGVRGPSVAQQGPVR